MAKNYVEGKATRKKSAKGAAWILIVLCIVFAIIVVKFAMNNGMVNFNTSGLPSNDDAYDVAKSFVKSTVNAKSISFSSSGYQIAKKSDSVYVVKSAAEVTGETGDKKTTNYKVLMHYNGGKKDEQKNWSLMNITED